MESISKNQILCNHIKLIKFLCEKLIRI